MTTASHSSTTLDDAERKTIARNFNEAVNMSATKLTAWLDTDDSKRVGQKTDGGESVGHRSGKHIIEILSKPVGELTDADYHHMRKVSGYVHRHLVQGPTVSDVKTSDWRYSLMNWGHDPLKD